MKAYHIVFVVGAVYLAVGLILILLPPPESQLQVAFDYAETMRRLYGQNSSNHLSALSSYEALKASRPYFVMGMLVALIGFALTINALAFTRFSSS